MIPSYNQPNWTEIVRYLYLKKAPLFLVPFFVAVLIAIFTLFIPNRYTSVANLLPSQRVSLGFDLFSEAGGLSSLASSVLGSGESEEFNRYIVLLSSHTTSKLVVEKFDLINIYEVSESKAPLNSAIEVLSERTVFESREEGNFIISVEDEDPERAKGMADYYIDLLNEQNIKIVSRDARAYREFIEKRYNQALREADSLKTEIITFQKKYGVFELTEQVKQYFSLIGSLTANQIEAEAKLQILSNSVEKSSDVYRTTYNEYEAINQALEKVYSDTDSSNILLNFDSLSDVSIRYLELNMAAEIQVEIQKFLLPIYEQAKMEEAKSLPLVSIIDEPEVPILKSFPKRSLIVIASGISTLILTLLYFITRLSVITNRHYFEYLKN